MSNVSNNAYALTVLSPIKNGSQYGFSFGDIVRGKLIEWDVDEGSPMAKVPQTYLARYFVLDDVVSQSLAGSDFWGTLYDTLSIFSDRMRRRALPKEDHLKSRYLVFSTNFHGDLETYLTGMWSAMEKEIRDLWGYCYGFDKVNDAKSFIAYIKKCQLNTTLFFVGSTDDSLEEQLKSLYLKQEFARFAVDHQGWPAAELQKAYQAFIRRVEPRNLVAPSWRPGQSTLAPASESAAASLERSANEQQAESLQPVEA